MNDELLDKLVKYPNIYVAGIGEIINSEKIAQYRSNID